jgi:hypothetical protein
MKRIQNVRGHHRSGQDQYIGNTFNLEFPNSKVRVSKTPTGKDTKDRSQEDHDGVGRITEFGANEALSWHGNSFDPIACPRDLTRWYRLSEFPCF